MKFFFNILYICTISSSFGAFKAVGNELDNVICNAMKGMQAQEEKKIPYNIGDYELIGITVDCEKKALITENKEIPDNSLVVGSPGKVVREVTEEEKKAVFENTKHYQDNWKKYSKSIF